MRKFIKSEDITETINIMKSKFNNILYDKELHTLYNYDSDNKKNNILRLPLAWPPVKDWSDYIDFKDNFIFIVIIIQSGQATIGLFDNNLKILEHKVLRTYTVRKKQGMNQIKYLKTKGKSRAGSRIRLKNTYLFFEDINRYLEKWIKEYEINRILYHVPKMLKSIWKTSKIDIPFDLDGLEVLKLPFYIKAPNFEEMKRVAKYSLDAEIKNNNFL